jgi:hypothetical protein
VRVEDAEIVWEGRLADEAEGRDVLPVDQEILYTDSLLGQIVTRTAGNIAFACAGTAGATCAETARTEAQVTTTDGEAQPAQQPTEGPAPSE